MPRKWWPLVNLYMVTWGQNVCRPVYPLLRHLRVVGFVSEDRRAALARDGGSAPNRRSDQG